MDVAFQGNDGKGLLSVLANDDPSTGNKEQSELASMHNLENLDFCDDGKGTVSDGDQCVAQTSTVRPKSSGKSDTKNDGLGELSSKSCCGEVTCVQNGSVTVSQENHARMPALPASLANGMLCSDMSNHAVTSHVDKLEPSDKDCRQPFVWCRWIAKWPKVFFVITLTGHLFIVAVTIGLYFGGYNILALSFKDFALEQIDDVMHQRYLAYMQKSRALDLLSYRYERHVMKKRSLSSDDRFLQSLKLVYDARGKNILTEKNLKNIQEFEMSLFRLEAFQDKFCQKSEALNDACLPFTSVVDLFYSPATNKTIIRNVTDVIAHAAANKDLEERIKYLISDDFYVNSSRNVVFATKLRSGIRFGHVYGRSWLKQYMDLESWVLNFLLPHLEEERGKLAPLTLHYFNSHILYLGKVSSVVYGDLYFLMGSVLFIFVFTWILTTSLWVTFWGIFSILTSFGFANLIYNVGIGYKYFGIFNILALYLVLGIGVDDIYVFFNTWKLVCKQNHNLDVVLDLCCRRAGLSMLITSITTMAAFFVSSFSHILPISSFGTFAGLTIFVNYLSVMVFFPTVVAVYHVHFHEKQCLCCSFTSGRSSAEGNVDTTKVLTLSLRNNFEEVPETGCAAIHHKVSYWFGRRYSLFVTHRYVRWVIITAFIALVCYMAYCVTTIRMDSTDIRLLRKDDPFETGKFLSRTAFYPTELEDPKLVVHLIWGLKPQDTSICNRFEYDRHAPCVGHTVWDSQFDINLPETQLSLLAFCEEIRGMTGDMKDRLRLVPDRKNSAKNMVKCVIKEFNDFLEVESSRSCYKPGTNLTLPMTSSKLQMLINCHQDIFLNISASDISHPFEVGLVYFLYIQLESSGISNLKSYAGLLSINNKLLTRPQAHKIQIYEAKLEYLIIDVTTSGRQITMKADDRVEQKDSWEEFMNNQVKEFPVSLKGGFAITKGWDLLNSMQDILHYGITGLGIGTGIAIIFILIGTRNIIISLLTMLTLAGIVICIVGLIPLAGWKIGVLEGLNMCFVVGLAVDYTVHMAQGYSASIYSRRRERIEDSLQHVAISILSGAVTTLGASSFMFFCRVHFFLQFGAFIFGTIGFSILFSLLFFPAILSVFGPAGTVGNLCRPKGAEKSYVFTTELGKINEAYVKTDGETQSRF